MGNCWAVCACLQSLGTSVSGKLLTGFGLNYYKLENVKTYIVPMD